VLAGAEALTVTTHLIWPARAAVCVALALWLAPGLPGAAQLGLFALLTMGFLFALRGPLARISGGSGALGLNRRAVVLVGREALVESFAGHEGRVKIDGVLWPARIAGGPAPSPGDRVRVTAVDGIVVRVAPVAGSEATG
jgi:membrane protein implicated in regulation of membrane protease activity